MKKILAIITLLTALAACERTTGPDSACGTLRLDLGQDTQISDAVKSDISDHFTPPAKDDYLITLFNSAGVTAWQGHLSEWDPELKITEGDYSVSAVYGTVGEEGLDKPCMSGVAEVSIKAMQSTEAVVRTSLANCILKISAGEMFRKYFPEYAFEIVTGAGNGFYLQEGQTAFVEPFRFTLNGACKTADGKSTTFSSEYTDLQAATAYTIYVEAVNAGGMGITVTFNDEVETISIDEDLN